ncbi:hypothetical protein FG386_002382 [Cryptosporidium ryanae]|uniref:uncharacterized protein n=1 Tax=Cryptosporidium ryanae TaxID=515981 RepID=UPI003519F8E7|nr:hypothetical protein FG386_002382 [Cryptosporidium ryanae]
MRKKGKKVKYNVGIVNIRGSEDDNRNYNPTFSLSYITKTGIKGCKAFSGYENKNVTVKEREANIYNSNYIDFHRKADMKSENNDYFPIKSEHNTKDSSQEGFENEFEFEDYYDNSDDLDDDHNKMNTKVENNILSSLEFIWSEIRSENVLERKQSFEYLEMDNNLNIKNRIPKNVLDQVSKVPRKLESLISFSMLLCLDTILYDLTFLPINSVIAFVKLILLLIIRVKDIAVETIKKVKFYIIVNFITNIGNKYGENRSLSYENNNLNRVYTWNLFSIGKNSELKNTNLIEVSSEISNINSNNNSSVEYIFEEKHEKSKSMLNLTEITKECRERIIGDHKSIDDGILSKNNNFLPQIKNYVNSFRMGDQKSSFEESELISSFNNMNSSNINSNGSMKFDSELNNLELEKSDYKCLRLSAIELTDISRFMVLLFSIFIFSMFDISFFYHYIRGQGLLKLYVIFNMLEVFEKLFRSFGRDLIDTFLRSVTGYFCYINFLNDKYISECANEEEDEETPTFKSIVTLYFVVICYLLVHCIIHMIRGLALNISLNSSEYTMFLIVITNNFAEIKSTVFKTYHSISLFTVACSDSIERFQLLYDGCILFLRMYFNTRLYNNSIYVTVITWVVSVFIVEIIVDWFKHSFLVKFNKINSKCYDNYLVTLIGDVLLSRGSNIALYHLLNNNNESEKKELGESNVNNHKNNINNSLINNIEVKEGLISMKRTNLSDYNGQYSISRGNTIGLEVDVSSVINKEENKIKKRKGENIKQVSGGSKEITFISKDLRNIYAFPYIVSRRIGFVSLPLTILLICVLLFSRLHSTLCINHLIIIWFILFIIKYLSSILIVSFSQNNIEKLKNWNPDFNKINAL